MYIYSPAFHTSYQFTLAYIFPDINWTFEGSWSENRPLPSNVSLVRERPFEDYDFYLAHGPLEFAALAGRLEELMIPRERIIYIVHWALQPDIWVHLYDGVSYEKFLKDVSNSAIVCVSHFMAPQFKFYSNVCVQAIPHYVPDHVYGPPNWQPGGSDFISVVNSFYAPNRGVGSAFWDTLDFANKKLYGDKNKTSDAGALRTTAEFREAVSKAAAYLWTADAVAISFAPLEAMILGCPVIAPRNLDWPMFYDDKVNIVFYEEGNYQSCKEAVEFVSNNPELVRDIAKRGRDVVLDINNATLFRERWSRVLDAAGAASVRGRRRLAQEARAPMSDASTVRVPMSSRPGFSLVTPLILADRKLYISHPDMTWHSDRQFIRKYEDFKTYEPGKYDLVVSALESSKIVFDIGRDIGFYGFLGSMLGASVRMFNRSSLINEYVRETAINNGLQSMDVVDCVLDKGDEEVWLDPKHRTERGRSGDGRIQSSQTMTLDDHISLSATADPDVIIIDDPANETNIILGALRILTRKMPELIIKCYRHGAYAKGASSLVLINKLKEIGYYITVCDWNSKNKHLVALDALEEPDFDVFLLHAVVRDAVCDVGL